MSIAQNIRTLEEELGQHHCKLVAVSKTKSVELIMEAYNTGFRRFGENKVQELVEKHQQLPKDIEWHMIGHLQRNKVKYLAPFVAMIHSVDNLRLLREINKQGARVSRKIPCLIQIHIAQEETKFGFEAESIGQLIEEGALKDLEFLQIKGLMGMATFTDDEDQIRAEFKALAALFHSLKKFQDQDNFKMEELSIGMSNDYRIAVEEGSTMVRIGSSIFGARD